MAVTHLCLHLTPVSPGPYPVLRGPQRRRELAPRTLLDHAPTTPPTTPRQTSALEPGGLRFPAPSFPILTYLLCLVLQLAQVSTDEDDVQTSPGELQEMHSFIYSRKPQIFTVCYAVVGAADAEVNKREIREVGPRMHSGACILGSEYSRQEEYQVQRPLHKGWLA